jgi:hypothetical protein
VAVRFRFAAPDVGDRFDLAVVARFLAGVAFEVADLAVVFRGDDFFTLPAPVGRPAFPSVSVAMAALPSYADDAV